MIKEQSRFFGINICTHCKHIMSYDDQYRSGGVCPYCGGLTNGTSCNIILLVVSRIDYYSEPSLWKRKKLIKSEYIGKDEMTTEWINTAKKNKWI